MTTEVLNDTGSDHPLQAEQHSKLYSKPGILLLVAAGVIFMMEALVMFLLLLLPVLDPITAALIDAAMLTVVIFPILYLLVFRPMQEQINRRKSAEMEKDRVIEHLEEALAEVKTLQDIIPMCASCKKIRDDQGFWMQVDEYLSSHADILISHGLCADCAKELYSDLD